MDQHEFHSLVEEMVHFSRDALPVRPAQRRRVIKHHDFSKRLATYFPSKASFNTKWNFADDDESTWEFCAPVAPSSRSSSSTNDTAYSSPAQEIIIRYRAGIPLDSFEKRSRIAFDDSHDSRDTASPLAASASFDRVSVVAEKGLKLIYRQSRIDALEDTREEAMAALKKHGLGERDNLVCHRPGCRDTLRDVKALMCHLHIHNIHDEDSRCATCGKQHENQRCPRRQCRFKSPPTSPIKENFFRIIGRIGLQP